MYVDEISHSVHESQYHPAQQILHVKTFSDGSKNHVVMKIKPRTYLQFTSKCETVIGTNNWKNETVCWNLRDTGEKEDCCI